MKFPHRKRDEKKGGEEKEVVISQNSARRPEPDPINKGLVSYLLDFFFGNILHAKTTAHGTNPLWQGT